jgi:subtilisin family serine protease
MSFGLKNRQKEIEDAIQEAAYSKSILIFAAASNDGGNSPVTYPARYEGVFCIFSTDGLGNDSKCNPTPMKDSTYHFATLGEAVKSAWPIHLVEKKALERKIPGMWIVTPETEPTQPVASQDPYRRMTGTSFATPIAAGIAACLLEFSIINKMDDEQYQVLRSRKGMRAVFSEKLGEERKGFHYIHPWKLFDRIRDEKMILALMTDVLKNV